jgi:cysteine synthase B
MDDLLASIGSTPLIAIGDPRPGAARPEARILAKAEFLNPTGSIKDRTAAAIVKKAFESGKLRPGMTLLDSTSGNTGVAYAMLGAILDFKVVVCLPGDAGPETRRILAAYQARVVETDPLLGSDGAQSVAEAMAAEKPGEYFFADQYNSEDNWRTHFETTGTEIWWQTGGRATHFVAGIGTSGTFTGVALKLKERSPAAVCVAVQPDSPLHGIDGVRDLSVAKRPGFYDPSLADATIRVSTGQARETARWLARTQGLFTGISSGANVFAALRLAEDLPSQAVVVTILCDGGSRYLGTPLWAPRDDRGPQ